MKLYRSIAAFPLVFAACGLLSPSASAQQTVECQSHNYQYTECQAPLDNPQLVHQQSSSACIINRTWGFNPQTDRIWVAEGCAGIFADVDGYHHGSGDTYDKGARYYDERGHDSGGVVAGLVVAALIGAAVEDSANKRNKKHSTSNNEYSNPRRTSSKSDYDGCHGVGCLVDNLDEN